MLHIILLLHLLSFTTGIIVLTLLGFMFFRKKQSLIKYTILADALFTLTLIFDSINYYTRLFHADFPDFLYEFIVLGLLISIAARSYYLLHMTYQITQKTVFKQHKLIFVFLVFISFGLLMLLLLLYLSHRIDPDLALDLGFIVSNAFAVLLNVYFVVFLVLYLKKISAVLRPFVTAGILIISIIEPLSLIVNLIRDIIPFKYPIAFSPILYFLINAAALYSLIKYLLNEQIPQAAVQETISYKHLSDLYHISKREYEIIELLLLGLSNQEISDKLFLSPHTVRNHIYNIYKKMQITSRIQLVNLVGMQKSNTG